MKNVKLLWLLWLFGVLPAFHHAALLGGPRKTPRRCFLIKCHNWYCLETKLGLSDSLPPKETSEIFFRDALPEGPWQDVIGQVLDNCYKRRTQGYTNTCPGQALLHCVVDQMIDFCPVTSTRKDDSCSRVTTIPDLPNMFTQSRYVNLEKNLPKESRPTWFLRKYFDSKCCDLPVLLNTTVLEECGFTSFINYLDHGPRYTDVQVVDFQNAETTPEGIPVVVPETAPEIESTTSRRQTVFMPFDIPLDTIASPSTAENTTTATYDNTTSQRFPEFDFSGTPTDVPSDTTASPSTAENTTTATYDNTTSQRFPEFDFSGTPTDVPSDELLDPLDCCEMTKFINNSWRSECDFRLSFEGADRLTISSRFPATEAPTTEIVPSEDIRLVPHSCNNETCVFRRMGIISDTGILDIDAYMKMLDNFTDTNPAWVKAKAKILTLCVGKPARKYEAGCEINNMLACTLDVLTEHCPYRTKSNNCYRSTYEGSCQISSYKYFSKYRREICLLPELIHHSHLKECGMETLYKVDHIPVRPKRWKMVTDSYRCKNSKKPTTCMLAKMDVLGEHFKMKDRIRQFITEQGEWAALLDLYFSAVVNVPQYGEDCDFEMKLLNALDAMLMTCPVSKRKNSVQCNKIFTDMTHTPPNIPDYLPKRRIDVIMGYYYNIFFMPNHSETASLHQKFIRQMHSGTVKKHVFDFPHYFLYSYLAYFTLSKLFLLRQ